MTYVRRIVVNILVNEKWLEPDFSRMSRVESKKRLNHAGAVLGDMLIVHGGLNSEENYMQTGIDIFDLSNNSFSLIVYSSYAMASRAT